MSRFDEMVGMTTTLGRRPLKTLAEFGGGKKSSTAATTDHGPVPPKTKVDPNSAYRPVPRPPIGGALPFPSSKRAKRTGTTASPQQTIPVRTEDEE